MNLMEGIAPGNPEGGWVRDLAHGPCVERLCRCRMHRSRKALDWPSPSLRSSLATAPGLPVPVLTPASNPMTTTPTNQAFWRRMIATFSALEGTLTDDGEKRQRLILEASKLANQDLTTHFEAWFITVDASTKSAISALNLPPISFNVVRGAGQLSSRRDAKPQEAHACVHGRLQRGAQWVPHLSPPPPGASLSLSRARARLEQPLRGRRCRHVHLLLRTSVQLQGQLHFWWVERPVSLTRRA